MSFGRGRGFWPAGSRRLPPGQTRAHLFGSSAIRFLAQTAAILNAAGSATTAFVAASAGSTVAIAGSAVANFVAQQATKFAMAGSATAAFVTSAITALGFDTTSAPSHLTLSTTTISNDTATANFADWATARGRQGRTTGKHSFQVEVITAPTGNMLIGLTDAAYRATEYNTYLGSNNRSIGWISSSGAALVGTDLFSGGVTVGAFSLAPGDKLQLDWDEANGFIYLGKNGVYYNSGDPTSGPLGTGHVAQIVGVPKLYPGVTTNGDGAFKLITAGFTPPSGYKVCAQDDASVTWATPYQGIVATRCRSPASSSASYTQVMSRTGHFARDAITQLKILVGNFKGVGELPIGAATTITASVEYPAGTFTQIKFAASASGTIPDGGTLLSDNATVSILNGAKFWIRQYLLNSSGVAYSPTNDHTNMGDCFNGSTSGITDQTMSGTVTDLGSNTVAPMAIIAQTSVPSVALVGDSVMFATNDTYSNASGDIGIAARSIGPSFGYSNVGLSGEKAHDFVIAGTQRRKVLPYCSHVIVNYGTNDINGGNSAVMIEADLAGIYESVTAGAKVFQLTITPYTSSTDAWATTVNQTPQANSSQRVALNADLTGAVFGPNGGVFDVAGQVTALSGGNTVWKANYTTDGLHPENVADLFIQSSGVIDVAQIHLP